MAEHLLSEQYKDPAAVMVGGVLEEHLRQLAAKAGVAVTDMKDGKEVPRKAESLNADLAKAGVYGKLDQKAVTGWLDLRNKAAHGKYSEYTRRRIRWSPQRDTGRDALCYRRPTLGVYATPSGVSPAGT